MENFEEESAIEDYVAYFYLEASLDEDRIACRKLGPCLQRVQERFWTMNDRSTHPTFVVVATLVSKFPLFKFKLLRPELAELEGQEALKNLLYSMFRMFPHLG